MDHDLDRPDGLWYVAYGSNLSTVRFQEYLDGCRARVRSTIRRPTALRHRLFFADHSRRWGGGPAFVDPAMVADADTRATAWLLDRSQFLDVLAMENGVSIGSLDDVALPDDVGSTRIVAAGRYGRVVAVDSPDSRLAFTFTTGEQPLPSPTRPGPAYVEVIVAGLVADHGMTAAEARSYLAERGA
ncbi:MAG: hypothetical protein OSA99_02125 [Acidimicrobiales bacterium]|nr:hypothetical protein [Acidimicrobiales bacterium]